MALRPRGHYPAFDRVTWVSILAVDADSSDVTIDIIELFEVYRIQSAHKLADHSCRWIQIDILLGRWCTAVIAVRAFLADLVDRILKAYGRELDAESRVKISHYLQTLSSTVTRDNQQLLTYGLAPSRFISKCRTVSELVRRRLAR